MKSRSLALLLANLGQVINLSKATNMHKKAIDHHVSTLKAVQKKLEEYTEQHKDENYLKTLSHAEKQCLYTNAQSLYTTHQELKKELDYLDLSKQSSHVINGIHELEHAYLLAEYTLELIGKSGETILPVLSVIKIKHFDKGEFSAQINQLFKETEALSYDWYHDDVKTLDIDGPELLIFDHLAVACMWFKRENERLISDPIPEIKKIEIPKETTPEIPKGPEVPVAAE